MIQDGGCLKRERYIGKIPLQLIANRRFVYEGYIIHSTSSFSGRSKYSNFTDEGKTYGMITAGGFDIVMWSRDLTLYGVEIKPELSLAVFRDAIGQVNDRMEERHWQRRIEWVMIVMPLCTVGPYEILEKKRILIDEFQYKLRRYRRRGYYVCMRFLDVPTKIYDGD